MSYHLDLSKEGLHMSFKNWELKVLEYLWSIKPNGATSKEVWDNVLQSMGEPISRASVINFLQDMAEKGVLTEEKRTGRGGYHGVYYHKYTESEFKQHIAEYVIRKLLKEFPGETQKVIQITR